MSNSDEQPPQRAKTVVIRSVWADNLEEEFKLIRSEIDRYPLISMDTEFPGIVVRPAAGDPYNRQSGPRAHYLSLKANIKDKYFLNDKNDGGGGGGLDKYANVFYGLELFA
ncbi:hypothetical protein D5086_029223 [Populus alba]|uniref:Uncharacterized protein n=1 Tax=Populus alba TaxID=43335 RepID=A0ACC4AT07_POPAL